MVIYQGEANWIFQRSSYCRSHACTDLGCFCDKHGVPSRQSGYVRWEAQANSFVQHGRHLLLFSTAFVEIREVNTGRLVQVMEDGDVRLLQPSGSASSAEGVLVAMRATGDQTTTHVQADRIVELLLTTEITATPELADQATRRELFREWDMGF
jgi:RHO1 GDP-GTP exchange protein 1/2